MVPLGLRVVKSDARISSCERYRYWLSREWSEENPLRVCFIGLNPSTADAVNDDPTIRRCINFAKRWGYGGLYMANLFAYRTKSPKLLKEAYAPIGLFNDQAILDVATRSKMIVCAWGNHGSYLCRDREVIELLRDDHTLAAFGITNAGQPKHPLYLPADSDPWQWEPPRPKDMEES